jgi:hypothetical protein
MAGYSATPLSKKLGIKSGYTLHVENPPDNYSELIAPPPDGLDFNAEFDRKIDLAHLFHRDRASLQDSLTRLRATMAPTCVIWVSWPKKASKVPTDITEDVIRDVALPIGLVDIKVCAVDAVWSGLKLMLRRELRAQ